MKHQYRTFTTLMICALFPLSYILTAFFVLAFSFFIEHGVIVSQVICITLAFVIMRRGVHVETDED